MLLSNTPYDSAVAEQAELDAECQTYAKLCNFFAELARPVMEEALKRRADSLSAEGARKIDELINVARKLKKLVVTSTADGNEESDGLDDASLLNIRSQSLADIVVGEYADALRHALERTKKVVLDENFFLLQADERRELLGHFTYLGLTDKEARKLMRDFGNMLLTEKGGVIMGNRIIEEGGKYYAVRGQT